MAQETPVKEDFPDEDDSIDSMEHIEMEQPKLSLSIIAEDTLEVGLETK